MLDESVAGAVVVVELVVAEVAEVATAAEVAEVAAVVEFLLAATAAVVAVLEVAEADAAAMHAPRVTVATTLNAALAILDRWAMRRPERLGDRGWEADWLLMTALMRGVRKTVTNRT